MDGQAATLMVRRQGILLALASFAMFTGMDTVVKLLSGQWHVLQVMLFTSGGALITTFVVAQARGGLHRLKTRVLHRHLTRWLISFASTVLIFSSYGQLALADVYAILFTSPLIATALSVPLLKEQVGWRRWSAVAVGFCGVLVMLGPAGGLEPVRLLVLGGAFLHACSTIVLRWMRSGEPVETFALYGNVMTVVVAGLAMPFVGVAPTAYEAGIGLSAGIIAGCAFMLLVQAYHQVEAGIIAPFQYSQMIYGLIVGFLLFGDVPAWTTVLGAMIVAASGIYVFRREAVRRRTIRT
ncbi:DMT family transporter [Geminicoccus roseus]|uniref:DMT family transporter n=1 Tax=Geminicoccus roseus TaxID=404900 RepID=UPI000427E13E|nr:DMT family transporter [Geminicoccus roseus]